MTSIIEKQFNKALDTAYNLYHNDRLLECQKTALYLLEDDAMPSYHRMKVLILLASILGDWEEANQCRVDAWALYNRVRCWNPVGNDSIVDEALHEVLIQLREADSALEEEALEEEALKEEALKEEAPEEMTLAEVQECVKIVVHNAENDIEATRKELEVFNMAEDDTANVKAELDVVKPTESVDLTLSVAVKPRKRNKKFPKFDLVASHAEPKDAEAAVLPPEPRTPFRSISFADAARSGDAPAGRM